MMMSHPNGMKRGFDLAPPMIEEIPEHRELGGDVVMLVDEELNQRRMIGHVIADLDRAEAVALKLLQEFGVGAAPSGR